MRAKFLFSLLCLFFILSDSAFANIAVFKNYDLKDGLLDGAVNTITEDQDGFIWLGTQTSLFRFDGVSFKKLSTDSIAASINVIDLFIDKDKTIWIGTQKHGLLKYSDQVLQQIPSKKYAINSVFEIQPDSNNKKWVSTDTGLYTLVTDPASGRTEFSPLAWLASEKFSAFEVISDQLFAIAKKSGFYLVNLNTEQQTFFSLDNSSGEFIHDLHKDKNNKLWIATSERLLKFDLGTRDFLPPPLVKQGSRYLSFTEHDNSLWVANIGNGIYKINLDSNETTQYKYNKQFRQTILEDNLRSVYASKQGNLWIGGFSKGLSLLNLYLDNFQYESNITGSFDCAENTQVFSLELDEDKNTWLGLSSGLVKYNQKNKSCQTVELNQSSEQASHTVYHTKIKNDAIRVSTSNGLLQYNASTQKITKLGANFTKAVFFSHEITPKKLLLGTSSGLYFYWINEDRIEEIAVPAEKYSNRSFVKYAIHNNGDIYLPSSKGLLVLDSDGHLHEWSSNESLFADKNIIGIGLDKDDLFVSVENEGLYHLNNNKLIKHYFDKELLSSNNSIFQIQYTPTNHTLWLGTTQGLVSLDLSNGKTDLFRGPPDFNYFSQIRASYQDNETLYFAGNSGYIHFKPEDIKAKKPNTKVVIDSLKVVDHSKNNQTDFNRDGSLNHSIPSGTQRTFSHRDKLVVIEFASLDYYLAENILYAYKLEPVFSDWIILPLGERRLTFTNLKAGDYKLTLNSIDDSNVWNTQSTNLSFQVKPAPWFTWWAYLIYLSLILLLGVLYMHAKIKKEKALNSYLNQQVEKQTAHIKEQKETVENLMMRRNEIFSNVTHEFRTPITLIQGPLSELEKKENSQDKLDLLSMASRNSKKLLRLVNQMLTLSEVVESNAELTEKVNVSEKLKMIADPYIYTAKNQEITLELNSVDVVYIESTPDSLDLIIGNLLSNAIKYTQAKGSIELGTVLHNTEIEIFVKDTGIGFDPNEAESIFKRFSRLPQNHDIEGAGIGLALVKEVVEINKGRIKVDSEKGKGSTFSVFFPMSVKIAESEQDSSFETHQNSHALAVKPGTKTNKETVLIIEDNADMRSYLKTVLADNFNCVEAENGRSGIALALKNVPDIIICDVMMPGIDGFHVCRLLREEMLTSHIPLILLTALTEKSSRIKGWRENIDMYLNKPFDADELNLVLRNILNIRTILKQKNLSSIEHKVQSSLPALDQKFIDKLKNLIANGYQELNFGITDMAKDMFVSERQLQRKTKALLDLSPRDLLREYRLKQAAKSLRDGYQISITSDTCGFSSVSYFSQSFKKYYGMTPKTYQQKHQKI